MLRDLLARYLETGPERVRFVYNAFGKPALNPQFGSEVTFNLSHSGRLALIAIARAVNVGPGGETVRLKVWVKPFDEATTVTAPG